MSRLPVKHLEKDSCHFVRLFRVFLARRSDEEDNPERKFKHEKRNQQGERFSSGDLLPLFPVNPCTLTQLLSVQMLMLLGRTFRHIVRKVDSNYVNNPVPVI